MTEAGGVTGVFLEKVVELRRHFAPPTFPKLDAALDAVPRLIAQEGNSDG